MKLTRQIWPANILLQREKIKRRAIKQGRLLHRKAAAYSHQSDAPEPLSNRAAICPEGFDDVDNFNSTHSKVP